MESSQCGDQHAHVLGFVTKVRTLKLFLSQVRELIHSKRLREILLVLTHDVQHVLVLRNFRSTVHLSTPPAATEASIASAVPAKLMPSER